MDEASSIRLHTNSFISDQSYLACSANLPEGLYILPMFFLYFFIYLYFLMVDFLAPVAQT